MRRSVSITQGALFIAFSGCLAACPPSRVNPVTNRAGQRNYQRVALGFGTAPPRVVFLELADGNAPLIRQHIPDRLEEADLMAIDPTLVETFSDSDAPRESLIARLAASSMGARLEVEGVRWAQVLTSPCTTELGTVARHGTVIEASADDATRVTLATLGGSLLPESEVWLAAPDRSMVAVELVYPGAPRVRDLHVFQTSRIDARLALLRATQALERGSLGEAHTRLDFAAARLEPGDPTVAAVAFARARLAAREGDVATCVAALTDATARDRRYRDQAVKHPDFDRVREDPQFIGFLALAPR